MSITIPIQSDIVKYILCEYLTYNELLQLQKYVNGLYFHPKRIKVEKKSEDEYKHEYEFIFTYIDDKLYIVEQFNDNIIFRKTIYCKSGDKEYTVVEHIRFNEDLSVYNIRCYTTYNYVDKNYHMKNFFEMACSEEYIYGQNN
jgi:hypothetical protein